HYTGRVATDPLGVMTQGEGVVLDGAGSQTGSNLARWGDYTSLSVDPSDDCTLWYTGEYLATSGAFNWHTRIGSFKLPGCSTSATHTTSVTLNVPAPGSSIVTNGGFETGNLSGWGSAGASAPKILTTPHSGSYSAQLGSTTAVNGDSTLTQTVTIPSGSSQLG